MALHLTHHLPAPQATAASTLALTAEERTRTRHHFKTESGEEFYLALTRGTVLRQGDVLQTEDGKTSVQIVAKPEPVLTVTADTALDLLRAAYHLGNRHVPLEVTPDYLRLSPDAVLKSMLEHMGLYVTEAVLPFQPEVGAYRLEQSHAHPS